MAKKSWADLSPAQRSSAVIAGALELAATAVTLRDLARQPASRVRGPKLVWAVLFLVQPFGPMAYWMFGRRGR